MSKRIAITPRSLSGASHPSLRPLTDAGYELVYPAPGRTPTAAELEATVPGCVGYLAGVEPVYGSLLKSSPHLKVIARNGVGVDNVDLDVARSLGIEVVPAAGANAQGVAELTLALAFSAARQIPWSDAQLKAESWSRRRGLELAGRTVGVVGLGNIGRRVATMASGVGMRVLGYDAFPDLAWAPPASFEWVRWESVLRDADVVTLHAPSSGKALIGAEQLAVMRPDAILINTARAALVDSDAVLAALDSGRLGAYCVDVHDPEPPVDYRLLGHDRVIATPHLGGFTDESVDRASSAAVEGLLAVLGR